MRNDPAARLSSIERTLSGMGRRPGQNPGANYSLPPTYAEGTIPFPKVGNTPFTPSRAGVSPDYSMKPAQLMSFPNLNAFGAHIGKLTGGMKFGRAMAAGDDPDGLDEGFNSSTPSGDLGAATKLPDTAAMASATPNTKQGTFKRDKTKHLGPNWGWD